jgi:hypothetical protein
MMTDIVRVTKFNEVHNRIECDPGIAMEIATYYTFDVPGAKFSPMYKNKVWDGKIRTFNPMNRLLYCGLNDHLKQFCEARDYDFVLDDGFEDTEFSVHEAAQFVEKLKPKHTPRDYQMTGFVHAVRKNRALLLSPTGSGKSLLIYMLSCYYRLKTLIIVPSTSLVHQMTSDFEDYGLPQGMVHKIMSGQEKDSNKLFFCSTWQSIYKMPKQWFQQFGLVIVDEAHLAKAKSITTIMNNMTNCKYRFGFTGTLDGIQCFPGDTLIAGTERMIEISKLIKGDTVKTFNENSQSIEDKKVLRVFNNGPPVDNKIIRITTTKGVVRCTTEHKVFTAAGWKKAKELTLLDEILHIS